MRLLKLVTSQLPQLLRGIFLNTGLQVQDTDASHPLTIAPGSNLTAARTLTLTTGDADRTVTLSGNPTLNDWFDQSVKTTADPTFDDLTLTGDLSIGGGDAIATADLTIRRNTSDASDNGEINIWGGGAAGITRGAGVTVCGNEASSPGRIDLEIGNVANSKLSVWNAAGTEVVKITGADGASWIKFNATQEASADANTLDDYEENTWTPSLGGTATYDSRHGVYTKIGRMVHIKGQIAVNTIGTGSTTTISGLPFTASAFDFPGSVGYFDDLATSVTWLTVKVLGSTSTLRFMGVTAAAAATTDPVTVFQNGTDIQFSAVYYV